MTSTLAKSAAVALSTLCFVGVTACSSNHTKQTPDQVFIASYNLQAPDASKVETKQDQQPIIGYGHDFCNYMKHSNGNYKASKNYLVDIDGLPKLMADAIFVAATDEGSLCPVS